MKRSAERLLALTLAMAPLFTGSQAIATPVENIKKALQPLTGKQPEPQPLEIRDKWAILIGCNRFADAKIPVMKFASKNAADVARTLKDPDLGRFAPDHVLLINGPAASHAAIKHGIDEWLLKKVLPADLVVVYVSSRMFPAADGAPLVCASDTNFDQPETAINLFEVLKTIKQRTQSEHIVCMVDTQPLPENVAASSKPDKTKDLKWLATSGATIFGATELFKPSYDDQTLLQSRFVHYLVEGMKQTGGAAPFYGVAEFVWQNVKQDGGKSTGQDQSPALMLSSPQSLTATIPLGLPVKSSAPPQGVALGYPLDQLSMAHPDIVAPKAATTRKTASFAPQPKTQPQQPAAKKPPVPQKPDDEDDDDVNPNVDFGAYMTKMKQDIFSKWTPPKGLESRRVSVVFSIHRDGSIVNPEVVESSGNEEVDKSAMAALAAASPLAPLPKGAPRSVDIRYVFDWKMNRGAPTPAPATEN